MQIKGVFDSRVVGGEEQNSFVEDLLLAAQKRKGTMPKAQMLLRRQIQELGAQSENFQTCKHSDEVRFLSKCL
jgi:hypothetical protein